MELRRPPPIRALHPERRPSSRRFFRIVLDMSLSMRPVCAACSAQSTRPPPPCALVPAPHQVLLPLLLDDDGLLLLRVGFMVPITPKARSFAWRMRARSWMTLAASTLLASFSSASFCLYFVIFALSSDTLTTGANRPSP